MNLIDDVHIQVGYCSETTANIKCVTLNEGGVVVTCSGGSVAQPTMTGRGDDNSARPGEFVAYTGTASITGLSPFTTYTGTVTHLGHVKNFSLRTLPSDDSQDWMFMASTCENHSQTWLKSDVWTAMREISEDIGLPLQFYAHIDDLGYLDTFKFFGNPSGTDSITGLSTTSTGGSSGAQDTALAWDYAISWLGWIGGLPSMPSQRTDGREWLRQNVPLWAQWGDHEVEGDHCCLVYRDSVSHGCNRGPTDPKANLEITAEGEFNAFCSDACTPPKQAADGGPASQADAQYWGKSVGPVRFFSYDRNKYSMPYDACDGGDTHSYGRSGTEFAGTCSGATVPTRSQLGVATDTQPPDFLGATQVTDFLTWLNSDEPFKVVFASNGITRHNQPWGDLWPDEFDEFLTRASIGLLTNDKTNGTDGHTCFIKGDTHAVSVMSYHADGTASGLGGAGQDNKELWEICPGTINGSTAGGNVFNGTNPFRGKSRFQLHGATQGDIKFGATIVGIVRGSKSPKELEIRIYKLASKKLLWRGIQYSDQIGNHFNYPWKRKMA